ncbi:MAG TPA: glycosyltransferase family 4 protein [Dongiaceae bacterium]|jgi:glycosyltransferase involved in cell wall biosynthesis|nr:glycosyltransferase family 4 protein [Dongiaceae bacterium]
MKIALFVHCFFPGHFYGTETYTLQLAREYRRKGVDVEVITAIFPGEPRESEEITRYVYEDIPVTCIDKNYRPNTRIKDTYYQPEIRPVLEKILREMRPDLIHVTHLINHTAALLEAADGLNIPLYATFTDFYGFCFNNKLEASDESLCAGPNARRTNCMACYIKAAGPNPATPALIRHASRFPHLGLAARAIDLARKVPPLHRGPVDGIMEDLARRPDILGTLYASYREAAAPTRFMAGAYRRNGFQKPMRDIWFGIDIARTPKPPRARAHRPVIGFIGQMAPHKGVDILITAFRRISQGTAQLKIYGPFDQDPSYVESLKTLAAGHDVEFCGTFPSERIADIMRGIDLLAIPSRWYENSPLVLLNALATHTPVLISDVAGMTEFLEEGKNGFAFARGSSDDLERRLRAILADRDGLFGMTANTHFDRTPALMAAETFAMYRA